MSGTDTKQSAGYFREKAIIGLSSLTGDEVDKALMKTTSHMLKAPKEKYMQSLLAASYGHTRQYNKNGMPINEYIVRELEKRSHTHNWIIVLKTMVVLHRLLTDGSDEIVAVICRYRNIFSFRNIKELGDTSSGAAQKYFIEEYMRYLEERASSQAALGCNRRIETKEFDDYMDSINAVDLLGPFEALLKMLETLLQVTYREAIVDNFCTMEAYQDVIRDGKTVFRLLSKRIIFVLSGFEDLPLSLKKMWLSLYKRYAVAAAGLRTLFDSMISSYRAFPEPIPQLKPLPDTLLRRLEQDVEVSMKPQVESLASLGIKCEDPRKDANERLPSPPEAPKRVVEEKPVVPDAVPTTVSTPAKPTLTMDDLFQPAPAPAANETYMQQQQQQQQQGPMGQYSYSDSPAPFAVSSSGDPSANQTGFGGGGPDVWSTGVPMAGLSEWSTGVPSGGGWSTGAPQFGSQPPPQQEFGYHGADDTVNRAPNTQEQQQPTQPARSRDPFKDLYSQTQQEWK